jgi:predicted LPLAT superfamily acyltransferase
MSFKPCLVIPIYNHGGSIGATVERLIPHRLAIYIVDDGSDAPTQAVLAALAAEQPLVRLLRLPANAGKGAAVLRGMREARAAGFSHALQIDADGQHDCGDVPRFLEVAAASPEAVVCGKPIYDASVPRSRLYGRKFTHFWVCVETLSINRSDSMCGFRLYPLAATCALIDRVAIPRRMDFDTGIFVRLAWAGLSFRNVETRVTYPQDGLSHFDMLRDNLRITRMHTLLTLGMLLRLPVLLWRKLAARNSSGGHWSKFVERGSVAGLRALFACYRLLGERAARLMLYPVVGYFFLTGKAARTASHDFLRRVGKMRADGRPEPAWRDSFRHMLAFGQSGLDKLAAWMGRIDYARVDFSNRSELDRLSASGQGALLIGSHLGNIEMMRALASKYRLATVNAVLHTKHAQRFNTLLLNANANFGINFIQVTHLGPQTAILLKEKIDRGELVVIVGDRTPPGESGSRRVSLIDFLGEPAPFAQGPFILASLLDCPVYLFFCLRAGADYHAAYTIHLELFAERVALPRPQRAQRLQAYMQQYARRLEHYCLSAPEQWFNFYDFWRQPAATHPDKA